MGYVLQQNAIARLVAQVAYCCDLKKRSIFAKVILEFLHRSRVGTAGYMAWCWHVERVDLHMQEELGQGVT
jgi:hypothetical protein